MARKPNPEPIWEFICEHCKETAYTDDAGKAKGQRFCSLMCARLHEEDFLIDGRPTRRIPLPSGDFALVDGDYDGEYLAGFHWYQIGDGYVVSRPYDGHSSVYLHRLVYGEAPKGYWVSFKNGNKLDCRSSNLKLITPRQSALRRPQGAWQNNSTGYRGVQFINGNYYTKVRHQYIGQGTKDPVKAAKRYDKEAYRIWGNKAILNFPK